ncbi:hypothetical protein COU37_00245 [Candidatus Micrarchaeota archaeon CG10_big_fil_rev_8_21_14_0_10_45_29]|nr:MAG: hypothetical protein COU37_00245 [Candidatus Micrarchaeota archaeon CG10_big_fil_rev_8_21_14_0_10_45_29]
MANSSYEIIGRGFGREKIKAFGIFLKSGGFKVAPEKFAGLYIVLGFLAALLASILFLTLDSLRAYIFKLALFTMRPLAVDFSFTVPALTLILCFAGVFTFFALLIYVVVILSADSRRNKVEAVLPDFLILAAANSRAGMTVDQALWHAAKPEFGLLSDEVQIVAKRAFGGVPFGEAIDHLAYSFNSKIIRRTVSLIKQGLASGSQIAVILDRTAADARDMQIIRRDIAASLLMYVIFIVFAAAIGTPFLFAVAAKLVALMENVFADIPTADELSSFGGSTFIQPQPPIVTSEQFFIFVLLSLVLTSITASLLIGVIQKGKSREGVKYLPFILVVGLVLFFVVTELVTSVMAGLGAG